MFTAGVDARSSGRICQSVRPSFANNIAEFLRKPRQHFLSIVPVRLRDPDSLDYFCFRQFREFDDSVELCRAVIACLKG